MNDKLNQQYFVDLIAERHNLSKDEAGRFVSEFFSLIEEALAADRVVKVKDFGTFKLIDVESRESVDVNTGNRIELSAHTKVSFQPDNAMREAVNKPFEHFETVVLNEGVTFSDVDEEVDEAAIAADAAESGVPLAPETALAEPEIAVEAESEVAASEPETEPEQPTVEPTEQSLDEEEPEQTVGDEEPEQTVDDAHDQSLEAEEPEQPLAAAEEYTEQEEQPESEEPEAEPEEESAPAYEPPYSYDEPEESFVEPERPITESQTWTPSYEQMVPPNIPDRERVIAEMYRQKSQHIAHPDAHNRRMRRVKNVIVGLFTFVVLSVVVCGFAVAYMYFPDFFHPNTENTADVDKTALDFQRIVNADIMIDPNDTLAADTLVATEEDEPVGETADEKADSDDDSASLRSISVAERYGLMLDDEIKPVRVSETTVPKKSESKTVGSKTEAKKAEAKKTEARKVEPKQTEVKRTEPKQEQKTALKAETKTTSQKASVSADPNRKLDEAALNAPVRPDNGNYKIVGTMATHTLQPGETLTRVALKYYGTKNLYPYIVEHNKGTIPNPNSVPIGTTLKIPELVKK